MTRDGTVGRFRRNRAKPGVSSGHRSRSNDEDSVRGLHQGQQSLRTAPTGRTHDCKRLLCGTLHFLLPGGGHPHMKRRDFIALLGGAAAACPLAARAQQPAIQVIGFLSTLSPTNMAANVMNDFRQGLKEAGFVEGQNVKVEYRWAEGHYDRLQSLADDLVRRQVTVIAATGGEPSPQVAKAATQTIPIVFMANGDPVAAGLVASLNRPGGNLTGVTIFGMIAAGKRLELLRQLTPTAGTIGYLMNPDNPNRELDNVQAAARSLGQKILVLNADGDQACRTCR